MMVKLLKRRYKIIGILAATNMSKTYLAEDSQKRTKCVVKQLKPTDSSFFPDAKRLFNEEAKILEKLGNNSQIPQLIDYFKEEEEFYLVQEYIEGHLLSKEMSSSQQWSESQVWQLLQEILAILAFVHQQGVIHRDIKPSNIIRRQRDGKLVLIDFGTVKQVSNYTSNDSLTVVIGTPGYMPPEQYRGKPRLSSDLYALGMMAIQALTGCTPNQLPEDEEGEIIWQDQVPVSQALATFLTKMVRSYLRERYQTVEEAIEALQQLTISSQTVSISLPVSRKIWLWLFGSSVCSLISVIWLQLLESEEQLTLAPEDCLILRQPGQISYRLMKNTLKGMSEIASLNFLELKPA